MSANREQFLNRIRNGLRQSLLPAASAAHPDSFQAYSFQPDAPPQKLAQEFARELEALSGHAYLPQTRGEIAPLILDILRNCHAERIIAWDETELGLPGLEKALAEAGIRREDHRLSADRAERRARLAALNDVVGGLSGAQGGLADTGSLVLISGPGRPRLASLLPPVHIALLPAQNLYPALPAFLAAHPTAATDGSNLVFITGPSRTADIEMTLSIGVHGPKEIHAIIVP